MEVINTAAQPARTTTMPLLEFLRPGEGAGQPAPLVTALLVPCAQVCAGAALRGACAVQESWHRAREQCFSGAAPSPCSPSGGGPGGADQALLGMRRPTHTKHMSTHARTHTRTHTSMRARTRARTHTHTHTHTQARTQIAHTRTHMHTHARTRPPPGARGGALLVLARCGALDQCRLAAQRRGVASAAPRCPSARRAWAGPGDHAR